MQRYQMDGLTATLRGGRLTLGARVIGDPPVRSAIRVTAVFACGDHTRRLPFPAQKQPDGSLICRCTYRLDRIFYRFKPNAPTLLRFEAAAGDGVTSLSGDCLRGDPPDSAELTLTDEGLTLSPAAMRRRTHARAADYRNKKVLKEQLLLPITGAIRLWFRLYAALHKVRPNRITFLSGRREHLSGNSAFVYQRLRQVDGLDLQTLLFHQDRNRNSIRQLARFFRLYATSAVVVADDYIRLFSLVDKPKGVRVIQLWHACGAFKTFGFSRLGKPGGPLQTNRTHRMYDAAVVSSQAVIPHYAEGFGLSDRNVLPLGVPRTDVFFDPAYAQEKKDAFYRRHPDLAGKTIVLFAPTFRGESQLNAFYPVERFDVNRLCEQLGDQYAFLIKLHPFCRQRIPVDADKRSMVLDLSNEEELNDLLFVTDLLITDYSSVIFEAALLSIPMLFYAYDLEEYTASRDFYYEWDGFVPGKTVKTLPALREAIRNRDFESDKIPPFRAKFFDHSDGGSAQRVAQTILNWM